MVMTDATGPLLLDSLFDSDGERSSNRKYLFQPSIYNILLIHFQKIRYA